MVTTIQVDEKIKSKLDSIKIHHRETYNELLSRMINNCAPDKFERESLIETIEVLSDPVLMAGLNEALQEKNKGTKLEDLKKELNSQNV